MQTSGKPAQLLWCDHIQKVPRKSVFSGFLQGNRCFDAVTGFQQPQGNMADHAALGQVALVASAGFTRFTEGNEARCMLVLIAHRTQPFTG